MDIEESTLTYATQSRIAVENAIKIIFPEVKNGIKRAIKILKKEYNISKEEQDLIENIWTQTSAILHGENHKLSENNVNKALKVLRNILMNVNNFKKEYEFDGLIYYKLLFNKNLMKRLKRKNIKYNPHQRTASEKYSFSWTIVDNIFSKMLNNDIFIPKAYFNSLSEERKQIIFLVSSKNQSDNDFSISLFVKASFDVNKLILDSSREYHQINAIPNDFYGDRDKDIIVDIEQI